MKFGGPLYEKLSKYGNSDFYGFHMPGHKRLLGVFDNPYRIDISEIEGFDDLHHPEEDGILTKAQERAARLYGAEETHFLVNGSTAGILSALSGCTGRNGSVLMARNCHRSVYHGAELRNLETAYLYPQQIEKLGINGVILPEDVEKELADNALAQRETGKKEIQAVIIVSPTYDGVCSDVRAIAEICHRYKKPLIVDQAHGAHFPFSEYFPEDALHAGADVVIHSVHKTLPSLTQTALLHVQGELADRKRIREYLSVYQSSSPSYVLMASIDSCMELLERQGKALFKKHVEELSAFRESCRDLKTLFLADGENFDRSKLLVSTVRAGISGSELSRLLLERYHIQMEMAAPGYAVGIAGIADSREGFARLGRGLHELDSELTERVRRESAGGSLRESAGSRDKEESADRAGVLFGRLRVRTALPRLRAERTIGEAREAQTELTGLSEAAGRLSGAYIYLYPPGIPLAAPGEVLNQEALCQIERWQREGFAVHGLEEGRLRVLREGCF